MKQQKVLMTSEIETLLNDEFLVFEKKWHGVLGMPEIQTLAKFIEQVKEKLNEPITNPA